MYIYIGLGISLILLYTLVIKPFISLLLIKIKFGKQAKLIFFPIFGDIIEIQGSLKKYNDHYESIRRYFRENKDLKFILLNVFKTPFILIGDPEINKLIHINHENYKKIDFLNNNSRLMGQGLLYQYGLKWKNQRQLLGKPFDYDRLKSRIPMMNQVVKLKLKNTYQTPLDLTRSIAGEVVIQTFFGKEAENAELNKREAQSEIVELFNDVAEAIYGTLYGFMKWMILGEKQWKIFPNKMERDINRRIEELTEFARKVIDNRITKIKQEGFKKNEEDFDFLDIHLKEFLGEKNSSGITKDEIISQFITLFFAGTDTTSSVAAMSLFYLAQYPNVYEALVKEIENVIGDGDVLDSHLSKLQELNSFIWEVLRVRNPASGPLVRMARQDVTLKDLHIKKGWIVMPANFVQQQTDKYFENFEDFDHKRFMKSQAIKEDNGFVNIPFSAGPRNCIGQHMAIMEIKIILCHILREFKINIVPDKMKNLQWKAKFLYFHEPLDCIQLVKK
ncbi:unnamed protein product [Paramecium primaurelia]|uniref:Cytochrome P450 n=1 Tax=Paramecium primaurelia TaxID=5886 RepID=A0A8S1MGU8_PARPR|nr:unnamed protein product [Paramecium primaurelia]